MKKRPCSLWLVRREWQKDDNRWDGRTDSNNSEVWKQRNGHSIKKVWARMYVIGVLSIKGTKIWISLKWNPCFWIENIDDIPRVEFGITHNSKHSVRVKTFRVHSMKLSDVLLNTRARWKVLGLTIKGWFSVKKYKNLFMLWKSAGLLKYILMALSTHSLDEKHFSETSFFWGC